MTLDQLNEANRLKKLADNSAEIFARFQNLNGEIFFRASQGGGCDPTSLHNGIGEVPLKDRPEVLAASTACMMLMRNALESEAKRHAAAFDAFTFPA